MMVIPWWVVVLTVVSVGIGAAIFAFAGWLAEEAESPEDAPFPVKHRGDELIGQAHDPADQVVQRITWAGTFAAPAAKKPPRKRASRKPSKPVKPSKPSRKRKAGKGRKR